LHDTQHVIIYMDSVTNTRHTSNQPQVGVGHNMAASRNNDVMKCLT